MTPILSYFSAKDRTYPVLRLPAAIFLFSLLFVLTRLAVLFNPEDSGWSLMVDELPTGNVALQLETDLVMPPPLYQTKPFAAGTLWEGLLSYPLRRVFGPTLFSLKSAAILWNLFAMALWMTLAWKWVGRGAALVVGSLYALSPPFYALMTVTAWGNHCESSLPAALSLLFLFPALSRRGDSRRRILAFASGLAAGLGVYLAFAGFPALVLGVLTIAFAGGVGAMKRALPAYAAGAFIGVSPLAWSARYYGWGALAQIDTYTGYASGVMVHARNYFMEDSFAQSFWKFVDFWSGDLWRSALLPEDFNNRVPRWLLVACVIAVSFIIVIARRRIPLGATLRRPFDRREREDIPVLLHLAFPLFILLYSVAYSLSGFRVMPVLDADPDNYTNYRYLSPLYPFLFVLLGMAVQDVWNLLNGPRLRYARPVLLLSFYFPLVILSHYFTALGSKHPPDFRIFLYRGDDALHLMERMSAETSKTQDSYGVKQDKIGRLRPPDRAILFERMSRVSPDGFHKASLLARSGKRNYQSILYRGLGWGLAERAWSDGDESNMDVFTAGLFKIAQPIPVLALPAFLEGVGQGMSFSSQEPPARLVEAMNAWNAVPVAWREAVKIGIGRKIGAASHVDDELGAPDDAAYDAGLGAQLRRNAELQCVRFDRAADAIFDLGGRKRPGLLAGFAREGREFFIDEDR